MINHYIAADNGGKGLSETFLDWAFICLNWLLGFIVFIAAVFLILAIIGALMKKRKKTEDGHESLARGEEAPRNQAPKVSLNEHPNQPRPKGNTLSLDSVSAPSAKPAITTPSPTTPPTITAPTPTMQDPRPAAASVSPGDFEKSLAYAGQRMDTLLAQTVELTHLLKLSEKAKTEATLELAKATNELKAQIGVKDAQLAKLENLLDRKSTYPSLLALIEIKKLCLDMVGTQKPLAHDELIAFVAGAVDNQLEKLDIQSAEFATGTPLDKIPGEQVEVAPRHEATEDPARSNQVARLLRPCYYLERDSKRIVIAKALVVLYRLNPSSPTTTPPSDASHS